MKKESRLYRSLGLLITLNLIIKPVWIFVIDRGVQNEVGSIEYGHYFSLFNLSIVLGFILDLGLTNYFNRQLATNTDSIKNQTGNFFLLKFILVIVYSIVLFTSAFLTGIKRMDIVTGLLFIQVFTFLFVFARAIITGYQWFQTDAWLSVLDKTLMIIFCSGFLFIPFVFGSISLDRFLIFQAFSSLIALIIAIIILVRRGVSFRINGFNKFLSKNLVFEILPFTLILLLMSAHNRLDGFLLERLHRNGAHEAGIYAASYRLLDAANMVGILFASFVLPYLAKEWKNNKDFNPVVLNIRHVLISFSIFTIVILYFLAPWLHSILYTHSDNYSVTVLQLCMPALAGYSLVCIYGTVMTATGQLYPFCKILLLALMVNIILNSILIPLFGASGCAIAAAISQASCGISAMYYCYAKLKMKLHWFSIAVYIFMAIVLTGFLLLTRELSLAPWLTIILASLLMVVLIFSTRLFTFRNWKQFLKMTQ